MVTPPRASATCRPVYHAPGATRVGSFEQGKGGLGREQQQVSQYLALIEPADSAPGGGRWVNRVRLLAGTVSRHDLGASGNVSRLAEIGLKEASPRTGGTAVSRTVPILDASWFSRVRYS